MSKTMELDRSPNKLNSIKDRYLPVSESFTFESVHVNN